MDLWHEIAGTGSPVLLIHAGICDSRMWEPQWQTFPPAQGTVRCDLRGFGRTPLPAEGYSHARDVAGLLDYLKIPSADIIGCIAHHNTRHVDAAHVRNRPDGERLSRCEVPKAIDPCDSTAVDIAAMTARPEQAPYSNDVTGAVMNRQMNTPPVLISSYPSVS